MTTGGWCGIGTNARNGVNDTRTLEWYSARESATRLANKGDRLWGRNVDMAYERSEGIFEGESARSTYGYAVLSFGEFLNVLLHELIGDKRIV